MTWIPPLFIPVGFFDFDIKIRYGYDQNINGWVSVNPNMDNISTEVDLCCFLEDLPTFWSDRISVIDKNPEFKLKVTRETSTYYQNLLNPFHDRNKILNVFRSSFVWIGQVLPWRNSAILFSFISLTKKTGIYKPIRVVWKLLKN